MKKPLPISDYDLIRYYEGDVEDPAELAAIEDAIDSDPITRFRLFTIADDFATIGLPESTAQSALPRNQDDTPETQSNAAVHSQPTSTGSSMDHFSAMIQGSLDEQLRSQQEFEAGERSDTVLVFEAERWLSQPWYAASASLAAANDRTLDVGKAETGLTLAKQPPIVYVRGEIYIHDTVENIPYGVVLVRFISKHKIVGDCLVALPRKSSTGENAKYRHAWLYAIDYLAGPISPAEIDGVYRIAAQDNNSLSHFSAARVRELLNQNSPPLDDELRGCIRRLIDTLTSKD